MSCSKIHGVPWRTRIHGVREYPFGEYPVPWRSKIRELDGVPCTVPRRSRPRVAVLCVILLAVCGAAASAEDHVPQPFAPGEVAPWLKDIWRAEAITVGSFPFSLFVTLEVYDTYRYFTRGFNPSYAPWPLGSSATTYSAQETAWLAVSAVSLSLVISGIDFLIGRANESAARH